MLAGDTFHVVAQGTFSVFDNDGQELVRLGKGSCFGEVALLRPVKTLTLSTRQPLPCAPGSCAAVVAWTGAATGLACVPVKAVNSRIHHAAAEVLSACGSVQEVRAANVRAVTDAGTMALHRSDLTQLLGPLTDIRHMWRFEALGTVRTPPPAPAGSSAPEQHTLL